MREDYPRETELDELATWPYGGYVGLMARAKSLWSDHGKWIAISTPKGVEYTLVTGGWSGNEAVINALRENVVFWASCWQSSERGGRHVFRVELP